MVAEMVIAVADGYVERHPTVELAQVLLHVTTALEDEVHDVEIAVACLGITAICQTQQGHC